MSGRLETELDLIEEAAGLADELGWRPAIEELAHWRHLATGRPAELAAPPTTGFRFSAAGRWAEIGCPYEEAMARFEIGTPDELRAAWAGFEAMGAQPMRDRAAAVLREQGAAAPRRPSPANRSNPHALTERELDVLGLLPTGGTNREIGATLGISAKTVGHHVSHILAKLGVRSRAEAAVEAERLGLTADPTRLAPRTRP
jgi:DNA-binding CsgD family transcriptional regulator